MIYVRDIYNFLNDIAPFDASLSFDNCGLLAGNYKNSVSKVLLALDITTDVVKEAQAIGAELIISHHPIIFKPLKNISFNSAVHLLCKFEINAICAHTNLDVAKEGVNYCLAKKLKINSLEPLCYEENQPLGLIGTLNESMSCTEFAQHVKNCLNCKGLRYTNIYKTIKKVAVCSGSGGDFVKEAYFKGADAFVTGEIKHSQILEANELKLAVVDAGHYKTENVIISPLAEKLKEHFRDISFFESSVFTDNIDYI